MVELELRLGESSRLWRFSFSGRSVRGFRLLTLVKSVPGMAVRYSSGSQWSQSKIKRSNTGVNIQPREDAQFGSLCKAGSEVDIQLCLALTGSGRLGLPPKWLRPLRITYCLKLIF